MTSGHGPGDISDGLACALGGDADVDDERPEREAREVVGLPPAGLFIEIDGHAAMCHRHSAQRGVALLMRAVPAELDLGQVLLPDGRCTATGSMGTRPPCQGRRPLARSTHRPGTSRALMKTKQLPSDFAELLAARQPTQRDPNRFVTILTS